jgi:hypothetical protein
MRSPPRGNDNSAVGGGDDRPIMAEGAVPRPCTVYRTTRQKARSTTAGEVNNMKAMLRRVFSNKLPGRWIWK